MSDAQKLVERANELARIFYAAHGYEVKEGYRFDQARHPQERGMWNLAAKAFEFFEDVDIESALDEIEQ